MVHPALACCCVRGLKRPSANISLACEGFASAKQQHELTASSGNYSFVALVEPTNCWHFYFHFKEWTDSQAAALKITAYLSDFWLFVCLLKPSEVVPLEPLVITHMDLLTPLWITNRCLWEDLSHSSGLHKSSAVVFCPHAHPGGLILGSRDSPPLPHWPLTACFLFCPHVASISPILQHLKETWSLRLCCPTSSFPVVPTKLFTKFLFFYFSMLSFIKTAVTCCRQNN